MIQTDPYSSGGTLNQSSPSFINHIKNYIVNIPLLTSSILFSCVTLFLIQCVFDWPQVYDVCFKYNLIINTQYHFLSPTHLYRLLTYPLFHLNVFHIAFNMMALLSIGYMLEVKMGTIRLLYSTLLIGSLFLSGLQLLLERLISLVFTSSGVFSCSVGFSGVLFAYMVISTKYDPWDRNLFGAFQISAQVYPWVLLLFTSLLFPGVSFLGHLCGILSGYLFLWLVLGRGWFNAMIVWTEKKMPNRIMLIRSFYVSSDIADVSGGNISVQSIVAGIASFRDSIVHSYRRLRDRMTGTQSYLPLSSSPETNQSTAAQVVGGTSNRSPNDQDANYWNNAGQGRALGSS